MSPALLDLCNVTIVHRFSSPAWYKVLHDHLASAASNESEFKDNIFAQIVRLTTGEALVFCPLAILDAEEFCAGTKSWIETRNLGLRYFKMKVRNRVTADGGKSILAHEDAKDAESR